MLIYSIHYHLHIILVKIGFSQLIQYTKDQLNNPFCRSVIPEMTNNYYNNLLYFAFCILMRTF